MIRFAALPEGPPAAMWKMDWKRQQWWEGGQAGGWQGAVSSEAVLGWMAAEWTERAGQNAEMCRRWPGRLGGDLDWLTPTLFRWKMSLVCLLTCRSGWEILASTKTDLAMPET